MGLINLPKAKWSAGGRQVALNQDAIDWEEGILDSFDLLRTPSLVYESESSIKIEASTITPVKCMLNGFPNILHPGQMVGPSCDGYYRENTDSTTNLSLSSSSCRWGSEKSSQWYAVFAIAADSVATFSLIGMPLLRYSSTSGQTITLRNNLNTADIGYGFAENDFDGAYLYILSGTSKGQIREITANSDGDDPTASTVTYDGDALSLTQGDWMVILPTTNFKFLGTIYNNSSKDIQPFIQSGDTFIWNPGIIEYNTSFNTVVERSNWVCPLADHTWVYSSTLGASYDAIFVAYVFMGHSTLYASMYQTLALCSGVLVDINEGVPTYGGSSYHNGTKLLYITNSKFYFGKVDTSNKVTSIYFGSAGYRYPSGYLMM